MPKNGLCHRLSEAGLDVHPLGDAYVATLQAL
jgi:hypothetical protein